MVNIKTYLRLEQICSSLEREGWIFISRLGRNDGPECSIFYRHPNNSRIVIDVYKEWIQVFRNKKLVKTEHIPCAPTAAKPAP